MNSFQQRRTKKYAQSKAQKRGMTRYRPLRVNNTYRRVGPTPRPMQETTMVKNVFLEDWVSSALLSSTHRTLGVQFTDLPDYASLQGVYDQYRINWAEFSFIPKFNVVGTVNGVTPTAVPIIGMFATATDYDYSNTGNNSNYTSMVQLTARSDFKFTRGTALHKRWVKVKANGYLLNQAGTVPARTVYMGNNPWIDCATPDVLHKGLQVGIEDSDIVSYAYDVMIRVSISLRNVN